ncbi:hypothetical protein NP493_1946g00003 [Ridgeia piscesae]|uniref:Uncharacterized protein n=1 Tax=Ridgeia piscesae TaxID=27915 RepID=A0AAD9N5X3_RIDPI|nr:hypothetical protein NP493_1946g00003 [Ridgeia piscesae]
MVHALIDAAYDKEPHVQEVICNTLCEVGKKRPNLVLASCHDYLLKHSKLGQGHRTVTLSVMERVVRETPESLDKRQVVDIIKQASSELTASKDVVPVWQSAASGLLVAIGCRHCHEVMAELLHKFQPGVLPHFMVVQTLANLAVANVYDMVPFLKVVLGTTLSVMGMAKQDNMKWIFSSAIAKFSEAIMDYAANVETAPDPSVRKEVYSQEMDAAYDIVFTLWLQSKEVKLKLVVVEALGRMSYIMSRGKLEEQFPRLLPTILSLYRRNIEPYHITLGLSLLLDAVVQNDSSVLSMHMDNLLSVIFPLICQPIDYSVPMTVKNHNEVLRCFAILVVPFSDRLVNYLLQKLEPNNDKTKMAVLAILRHLINSAGPHIEDKQALIMSGLKALLPETSNKVKKVLAQTVIAMAHHNYLEMEGGHLYIKFIVHQCALPSDPQGRRPIDPDYVSNDALRSMCDDVLLLLSTTVDNMQYVLWPYLLECVVPQCYTDAMATVCRTMAHIAGKKREEKAQDYHVDFERQSDIPKPPALIARLMVMAGHPLSGRRRGVHVLTAMKALSPLLHESLVELWDAVIPKLIQYVEDGQQKEEEEEAEWSQKNWEDLLLKLLSKSLEELSDEKWTCDIGRALMEQLSQCTGCAEDKNFLLKCLGVVLRQVTTTLFVQQCLHDAFSQVQHSNNLEREGYAIAAGFAAAAHLDSVLEVIARLDAANRKSSSSLFSFIKVSWMNDSVTLSVVVVNVCRRDIGVTFSVVVIVCRRDIGVTLSIVVVIVCR